MTNLIAKQAPEFNAKALTSDNKIENDFSLNQYLGKYVILFFYPMDFTFVCPTEILAFNEKFEEFKKRNAEVVAVSVDSVYTHLAWKKTPVEEGGIGQINYPMVSDIKKEIGNSYGVLIDDEVALRALFLIDRDGIVRHYLINDNSIGRSVDEALRILDAVRHFDEHGKVCPANWTEGETSMEASTEGVVDYLSKYASKK